MYLLLSVANIHCLYALEYNEALSHLMSEVYTWPLEVLVWCSSLSLIACGSLRFLTLYRNSEVSGLQILGPEHVAIVKVRFIALAFSIIFEATMASYFKVHTGFYSLLNSIDTISVSNEIAANKTKALMLALPFLALIISAIVKLYSVWLVKKISTAATVFTVEPLQAQANTERKRRIECPLYYKIVFCWLGHLKMSFYYPTSHRGQGVVYLLYIAL